MRASEILLILASGLVFFLIIFYGRTCQEKPARGIHFFEEGEGKITYKFFRLEKGLEEKSYAFLREQLGRLGGGKKEKFSKITAKLTIKSAVLVGAQKGKEIKVFPPQEEIMVLVPSGNDFFLKGYIIFYGSLPFGLEEKDIWYLEVKEGISLEIGNKVLIIKRSPKFKTQKYFLRLSIDKCRFFRYNKMYTKNLEVRNGES
jgi:hypothetical protein